MINPLTVVKIGSADYKPTFADLEAWRSVFEEAQYDKDFKIFTHEGVDVTRVGYGQGIFDIAADITQIIKEICDWSLGSTSYDGRWSRYYLC